MKFIPIFSKGLLLSLTLFLTSLAMEPKRSVVVRKDFFNDSMGMDEQAFRSAFGWDISSKTLKNLPSDALTWIKTSPLRRPAMPANFLQWIKQYPRRAAIFAGTVEQYSLRDINKNLSQKKKITPPEKARFRVQLHDPLNPTLTDVRSLLTLPENKNAGFQVASTFFGMLEGGMENPQEFLSNMVQHAAQGEEVSIATAPATIYRKYFYPQGHLLEYLKDKVKVKRNSKGALYIDPDSALNYTLTQGDKERVSIGLHRGAVVSSGPAINPFKKPGPDDTQFQVPINVKNDGTIDSQNTQTVNLFFTAAYKIPKGSNLAENISVRNFCQMLLDASYEATLKSQALTGQRKIFLTLMGASAFGNPIGWIDYTLITDPIIGTIEEHGLDVTLIYRMDKKPHRNAREDAEFLLKIFRLEDIINKTNLVDFNSKERPLIQKALHQYTTALYTGQDSLASSLARDLEEVRRTGSVAKLSAYKFSPILEQRGITPPGMEPRGVQPLQVQAPFGQPSQPFAAPGVPTYQPPFQVQPQEVRPTQGFQVLQQPEQQPAQRAPFVQQPAVTPTRQLEAPQHFAAPGAPTYQTPFQAPTQGFQALQQPQQPAVTPTRQLEAPQRFAAPGTPTYQTPFQAPTQGFQALQQPQQPAAQRAPFVQQPAVTPTRQLEAPQRFAAPGTPTYQTPFQAPTQGFQVVQRPQQPAAQRAQQPGVTPGQQSPQTQQPNVAALYNKTVADLLFR